ncbi:hypothetical protein M3Y99_00649300 [Aphelenchoides fujianensis]|nr:hypothetical protein M3Y99_00649300 [Aphelenchoides fujianensis]
METPDSSADLPQNSEDPARSNGKKREFVCPDCELVCRDSLRLRQHAFGHLLAAGWQCSVCDVRFAHALRDRNRHEQNVHRLERHPADLERKEAVRVTKHQLSCLVNVGCRLVATQLAARPSLSAANGEATADELHAHMLKTLRPRKSQIPAAECERPIAAEKLPQSTEQTAVKDSLIVSEMPAEKAQKRDRRVLPVQPFVRRELFASDEDEEETSMSIKPSSPKIRKLATRSLAVPAGNPAEKAAARPNGEPSALSSAQSGDLEENPGGEEATEWRSQPVEGENVRQSSVFESESEEEEKEEEGEASEDFRTSQPKNTAMRICPTCDLSIGTRHFGKHVGGHSLKTGWQCALCGIRTPTMKKRRVHEHGFHGLRRCRFDQDRREAILLEEAQLKKLRAIGTNFREIQREAVRSVAAFVQLPTLLAACRQPGGEGAESRRPKNQRQSPEVIVLDD